MSPTQLGAKSEHGTDFYVAATKVFLSESLVVNVAGGGQSITVATPLAQSIVGDNGWWLIFAPRGDEKRLDLGQVFGGVVGLASTSDPSDSWGGPSAEPEASRLSTSAAESTFGRRPPLEGADRRREGSSPIRPRRRHQAK